MLVAEECSPRVPPQTTPRGRGAGALEVFHLTGPRSFAKQQI